MQIYFGERLDQKPFPPGMGFEIRSVDEQDQTFASYAPENRLWSEEKRMNFEFVVPLCRYAIMPPLCRHYAFVFFGGGKSTSRGFFAFCMYHFQLLADIFHCSGGEAQSLPVKLVRHGGIIDSWQVGDHRDDWK